MSSNIDLNVTGDMCLGTTAALAVNVAVQPICTIKNRVMAKHPIFKPSCIGLYSRIKFLYSGISVITTTEIAQNCLLYSSNGYMKSQNFDPWVSSAIAGALSAPAITLGEGIMLHQQVNTLSLAQSLKKAFLHQTLAGWTNSLAATVLREVPYGVAVFALPKVIEPILPISHEPTKEFTAGFISGVAMGILTTPLDVMKTRVQADSLTLKEAGLTVLRDFRTLEGLKMLLKASAARVSSIAIATAIMNLVNNLVPGHFPSALKKGG